VEATEHMQMGMLANLYVRPAQNGASINGFTKFVYNDGDGSTGYDREFPIQMSSFDGAFHDASESTQPLPFALMRDDYPMLNGRGYPDTLDTDTNSLGDDALEPPAGNGGISSQFENAFIEANEGERVLLRLSNLSVTKYFTLATNGPAMKVVGRDARLLRGPSPDGGVTPGLDLYFDTSSVTLGGGESADAIFTAPAHSGVGTDPDVYFLYTTNFNYLNNGREESDGMGGMLTEIRIYQTGTLPPQITASSGSRTAAAAASQMTLETE